MTTRPIKKYTRMLSAMLTLLLGGSLLAHCNAAGEAKQGMMVSGSLLDEGIEVRVAGLPAPESDIRIEEKISCLAKEYIDAHYLRKLDIFANEFRKSVLSCPMGFPTDLSVLIRKYIGDNHPSKYKDMESTLKVHFDIAQQYIFDIAPKYSFSDVCAPSDVYSTPRTFEYLRKGEDIDTLYLNRKDTDNFRVYEAHFTHFKYSNGKLEPLSQKELLNTMFKQGMFYKIKGSYHKPDSPVSPVIQIAYFGKTSPPETPIAKRIHYFQDLLNYKMVSILEKKKEKKQSLLGKLYSYQGPLHEKIIRDMMPSIGDLIWAKDLSEIIFSYHRIFTDRDVEGRVALAWAAHTNKPIFVIEKGTSTQMLTVYYPNGIITRTFHKDIEEYFRKLINNVEEAGHRLPPPPTPNEDDLVDTKFFLTCDNPDCQNYRL